MRIPARVGNFRAVCLLAAATVVGSSLPSLSMAAGPASADVVFEALLDGKPIGEHRFTIKSNGDVRTVDIEATFNVKLMGITVYRYHHKATEQWRGDCLVSLVSHTDDGGKSIDVKAAADGDRMTSTATGGTYSAQGCVMSFAYWNPVMRTQKKLLNAQTGEFTDIQITSGASGDIDVKGESLKADQFRITGPEHPVDIWYSAQGDWIGLDSIVTGGRKLTYRIR